MMTLIAARHALLLAGFLDMEFLLRFIPMRGKVLMPIGYEDFVFSGVK